MSPSDENTAGETDTGARTPRGKLRGPPPDLIRLSLVFYGGGLALTLLAASWFDAPLGFASAQARMHGVSWWFDATLGIGSAVLVIAASRAATRRTQWGNNLSRGLAELMGRRSTLDCAVLALASGVAEETLFRGLLQPALGVVAASLLFGLAHFAPRRDLLPWTGFAVAVGFLFGVLFEITGNLVAPVVAHITINAVNLRWLSDRYFDT
jgi:membrane protease YdiL (CAAX protease family)